MGSNRQNLDNTVLPISMQSLALGGNFNQNTNIYVEITDTCEAKDPQRARSTAKGPQAACFHRKNCSSALCPGCCGKMVQRMYT